MLHAFMVSLLLGVSCAVPSPQNDFFNSNNQPNTGQSNPLLGRPAIGRPVLSGRPVLPGRPGLSGRPVVNILTTVAGQVKPTLPQNNRATGSINPAVHPSNPAIQPNNPAIQPNNPVAGSANSASIPVHANPGGGQANSGAGQVRPSTCQANLVGAQANIGASSVNDHSINQVVSDAKLVLGRLITEFGQEISEMIHQNGEQDNVVFSPLSIATLMTLLLAGMGKQSQTYFEAAELLGYNNGNEDLIHELYKSLLKDLSIQNNQISFSMGNRLFLQEDKNNGVNILGSFTKTAKDNYNAGIETLNFFSDPFGAANRINEWVNIATNEKIPQLLTDPLSPQTKFMAVNTVYFKAPWLSPFNPVATIVKPFDTGRGKIDIPFMSQIMSVRGHELVSPTLNATIAELPYIGERYSMFIMKPKGPASVNSVIQMEYELNYDKINFLIEEVKCKLPLPISVQIPRMRLRYRTYLKEILENLGAKSMFSVTNADFSRITSSNLPILDNMIHEAVMDITEEGTEAAAATSTTSNRFGTNLVFELNQPSLLFIYDSKTKVPIFWARLVTPESI